MFTAGLSVIHFLHAVPQVPPLQVTDWPFNPPHQSFNWNSFTFYYFVMLVYVWVRTKFLISLHVAVFLGNKQSTSVWVLTQKTSFLLNFTLNLLLFAFFFQLFSTKNAGNHYFDQHLEHPNAGQNIKHLHLKLTSQHITYPFMYLHLSCIKWSFKAKLIWPNKLRMGGLA